MANEWARGTFAVDPTSGSPPNAPQNVINGISSLLTSTGWALASWSGTGTDRYYIRSDSGTSNVWNYNGDGTSQLCGIRLFYNSASTRFEISCFLQNTTATGSQRTTLAAQINYITWDTTAVNNYLVVGGEHGLYIEAGRDGSPNNLGHACVMTHVAVPEFYTVRGASDLWNTQGFCVDLTGQLKIAGQRTTVFVTNDGTNRCFTTSLAPALVRGSYDLVTFSGVNDIQFALMHRQILYAAGFAGSSVTPLSTWLSTFGTLFSPVNGKYVVSPLMYLILNSFTTGGSYCNAVGVGATASTATPSSYYNWIYDARTVRQVKRFAAVDYSLLGFSNIQDAVTGIVYRVAQFNDGGRSTNLGVEWPASSLGTLST